MKGIFTKRFKSKEKIDFLRLFIYQCFDKYNVPNENREYIYKWLERNTCYSANDIENIIKFSNGDLYMFEQFIKEIKSNMDIEESIIRNEHIILSIHYLRSACHYLTKEELSILRKINEGVNVERDKIIGDLLANRIIFERDNRFYIYEIIKTSKMFLDWIEDNEEYRKLSYENIFNKSE